MLPKGPDTLHFRGFLISPICLDLKPAVFYGAGKKVDNLGETVVVVYNINAKK